MTAVRDALAELVACNGERSPKSAARLINAWAGARAALAQEPAVAVPREVTCPHCGMPFEVDL